MIARSIAPSKMLTIRFEERRRANAPQPSENRRKNRVSGRGEAVDRVTMNTNFRIVGLPLAQFQPLLSLDDNELAQKSARRLIVDAKPGFPCRVSLQDAEVGERVILVPFVHHEVESPYRASGPIFVRETAEQVDLEPGKIPEVVASRVMSVRAYNDKGMMINAAVTSGKELKSQIEKFFSDAKTSYLHLHNAGAGCYSCRVDRVKSFGSQASSLTRPTAFQAVVL
jgi:hypothetical protein